MRKTEMLHGNCFQEDLASSFSKKNQKDYSWYLSVKTCYRTFNKLDLKKIAKKCHFCKKRLSLVESVTYSKNCSKSICTTSKLNHLSYNNHISISKDNAMVKNVAEGTTVQKFVVSPT